jgi:hypothetical protein
MLLKLIYSLVLFFSLGAAPLSVLASDNFSVAPLILDISADARDSFVNNLTLTSHNTNNTRLYASVNEITLGDNSEIKAFVPASMSDRTTSVTSWIEVTRGRIDLVSGEVKEVPVTVRINPNTPAGLYHAFVGFAQGTNRDEAEAKILAGQGSGVVLRILVGGKQDEFLKLVSFTTDRFSYKEGEGSLVYVLQNVGDVPLSPKGDVIIYNSRGSELTSISLNKDESKVINPGETLEYKTDLPFINRLGKNKAYLSLEYGSKNRTSINDTSFYYSVPLLYLLLIMLLLILVFVILTFLIYRAFRSQNIIDTNEAHDLPLFVRNSREHSPYDHDIDLKKKD